MDIETLQWTLSLQYGAISYTFEVNLEGLSDDDALVQPAPGGNCVNWVAGHIVQARGGALALLGQACPFPADRYDRYRRGSPPIVDATDTVPLSTMKKDFAATAEPLKAGIAALASEFLVAKAPISPGGRDDETCGSLLVTLVFHESYHCGQLGVLRRLAGAKGAIA